MTQYPNICELITIMLSIAPATGLWERSYAKLAKICYKGRNELHSKNIEILYLLAVLQINNKVREILKTKKAAKYLVPCTLF